jgi:hypothetical protein
MVSSAASFDGRSGAKAALVARPPWRAALVEHLAQRVKDLCADPERLRKGRRTDRKDHEFLMSTLLSAWAPPLMMFIMGTGSRRGPGPPSRRYRLCPLARAAACAAASETARSAFAPSRDLVSVPSSAISVRSRPAWSSTSWPSSASRMGPLTLATACRTPLPK